MLRNAIIERLLAEVPKQNMWMSVWKGFKEFFMEFLKFFKGSRPKDASEIKIGDKFYDHPIIKNYGASGVFPLPSYISAENFSTVLKEVLKEEFHKRQEDIVAYNVDKSTINETRSNIDQNLSYSPDIVKIKEVIEYYGRQVLSGSKKAKKDKREEQVKDGKPPLIIDEETLKILQLHLHDSLYDIQKFSKNLENWYDDSMDRVSGWYKRQTQTVLFFIGITIAIIFNVDTIGITNKLSKDKDAREKMLQLAIEATDKYKDDPRVKKTTKTNGDVQYDTTKAGMANNDAIFRNYQDSINLVIKDYQRDVDTINEIIALGWADYGMRRDSAKVISEYISNISCKCKNDPVINSSSPDSVKQKALNYLYDKHWIKYKVKYVLSNVFDGKKFLGFMLTAFAISLGAPFWFDLLNKLVKIRTAGKKEDSDSGGRGSGSGSTSQTVPIIINTQTGEGAVG